MSYKLSIISIWILLLCSCTKEEVKLQKDLDRVYVNVSYNNEPIKDAFVFIDPEKEIVTTNSLGVAEINGSFNITDTIFAYQPIYGGAKSVIKKNDGTNYLNLQLSNSVVPKNIPVVQVKTPVNNDAFLLNEPVIFSINGGNLVGYQSIGLIIKSCIDGIIYQGQLPENGIFEFSKSKLSIGIHTIEIETTDEKGLKFNKSLIIQYGVPEKIQLIKAEKKIGYVDLNWERSLNDYFESYDIYTSSDINGEIGLQRIVQIKDRNITTYRDLFPPLKDEVYYFIRVQNYLGLYNKSNSIKVEQPNGEIINIVPDKAFISKNQNGLILWNKTNAKLLKYDLNNLKIEFEKDLPSDIVDIDVDQEENGNIYTVSNAGKIYVYSSTDLSLLKEVNYSLSTFSIIYMCNNKVMLSCYYSGGWNENNHVVDLTDGIAVSKTGRRNKLVFKKIPGKKAAISLTTSISPVDMAYYEWDNEGKITIYKEDTQHGDYPLSDEVFAISDLGNYCITHNSGALYTADNNMTYLGKLNNDNYYMKNDFCILEAKDAIYGTSYPKYGSSIENKLIKYSLSGKSKNEEYTLKGKPQNILNTNNNIVIVSLLPQYSNKTIIEFKDIK